ncbi:hypothetical protein [Georgenia alba]|uniref:DNA modification methylase n=1 Tax=Georgenia alba TaxID=2233858 RepID=A0ABW2Q4M1_9MICO
MARTTRRTRLVSLAATGIAVAAAAGGCATMNPITTAEPYAPSDGVRVPIRSDLVVENLMVLTEADGETGHLLGAVVNRGTEAVEVSFTFGESGAPIPVTVEPEATVNFTEAGITVDQVEVPPGAVLPSVVATSQDGETTTRVPVLDGTIPPYDDFLESAQSGETWTPSSRD